jgi:sugar phosphate isomerase/epimerase
LEQYGLENCGWHTEWELLQPDLLPSTVEYLMLSGTRNVIYPPLGGPWEIGHTREEDCPEAWIRHAREMNVLNDRLRQHGLRLGYHTHTHEFTTRYEDGLTPWDLLCEYTDPDIILELDTGNCLEANVDPVQVLAAIIGRPLLVHCKPYSRRNGLETFIGAEDDDSDWPAIVEQCRLAGTQWLVVEHESERKYPGFDGAERCLQGIQSLLKG